MIEKSLNREDLKAFNCGEVAITSSKFLRIKVEIKEYDAKRLLQIISEVLERSFKKKTWQKITGTIIKNVPPDKPEAVFRWLINNKEIKKVLISSLNGKVLKKWSLNLGNANIKRDEENILHLLVEVEISNFSDLLDVIKKEVLKKIYIKHKRLVEIGLEAINSEIKEKTKAELVYNILGSAEFNAVLDEIHGEILHLIEELLQEKCKLSVELNRIDLKVVDGIKNYS